jgi:hypothetical protein
MASAELLIAEMESFYRQYIDAFNGEDLTALAGYFSYPWAVVSGARGMNVINDEAGFVRVLQKMKASLKARGWTRSGIDLIAAWPTAKDAGLLMADYTRHRSDGGVLERGRTCYTIRRDSGRWKIVSMLEVAEPFLGPGSIARSSR